MWGWVDPLFPSFLLPGQLKARISAWATKCPKEPRPRMGRGEKAQIIDRSRQQGFVAHPEVGGGRGGGHVEEPTGHDKASSRGWRWGRSARWFNPSQFQAGRWSYEESQIRSGVLYPCRVKSGQKCRWSLTEALAKWTNKSRGWRWKTWETNIVLFFSQVNIVTSAVSIVWPHSYVSWLPASTASCSSFVHYWNSCSEISLFQREKILLFFSLFFSTNWVIVQLGAICLEI